MSVVVRNSKPKRKSEEIVIPSYMLDALPNVPTMEEENIPYGADGGFKWTVVETHAGWRVSDERTRPVVDRIQGLGEQTQHSLEHDLATPEGSKDLLERLEYCIGSERFQGGIWNRVQEIGEVETDDTSRLKTPDDIMESSFVLVTHQDVVDSLAEYLVLSYMDNYHRTEIDAWKVEGPGLLTKVCKKIIRSLKELAKHEAMNVVWNWGSVFLPTSSLSAASFAFCYPETALFVIATLWKILSYSLGVLL